MIEFTLIRKILQDGTPISADPKEDDLGRKKLPIGLTKKGFDVALENEKQVISFAMTSVNNFLIAAYVLLTLIIALYYLTQLAIESKIYQPIWGFISYLIVLLYVGYFGIPKIGKTLKEGRDLL